MEDKPNKQIKAKRKLTEDEKRLVKTVEENLPTNIKNVIEDKSIPEGVRYIIIDEFVKLQFQYSRSEEYSGLLPHPNHLKEFEKIIPNGGDRMLKMAEEVTYTNTQISLNDSKTRNKISLRAQPYTLALSIICIGLSAFFAYIDKTAYAITLITTTVLGLAGVFITGKVIELHKSKNNNSEEVDI